MDESEAAKVQPILKVRGPSTPVRNAAAAAERRLAAASSARQVYVPPSAAVEDVENRIPAPSRVPLGVMGNAAAVASGGPPRKSSLFGGPPARTSNPALVRPVSANRNGLRTPNTMASAHPATSFTSGFGKSGGFKITRLQA